ncbi:MAG TPA: sugar phosphate isomerase/epimerase [Terriglobales bacterium]|jgi:sugar phosphate isomerase/epimerase|nr:sugar phosphate isomerase/epimerase [Terriglobales bacterium]
MLSRRKFLRLSATAAGSIAVNPFSLAAPLPSIGVQLYTVRKEAEGNLPQVLRQIRAIGYDKVETYWNVYSHPAKELRKMIADAGLTVPSGHFDYDGLSGKFGYAKELGLDFVVCPMLPKPMWDSLEGFQRAADQFNRWGERAKSMGMRFAFHNHNYEFRHFGQTTGFDTLVERTDPKLVFFEMDCYWITQAGEDPVATLRRLGQRIRLLHIKDRKPGFAPSQELNDAAEHFTEVGNGSIEWKSVLATARASGVEQMFVEQDESERPPVESLRISYHNLQKLTQ